MVFPCGHEKIQEATHIYGCRFNGKRPIELHITGELPAEGKGSLRWHMPTVHPVIGKVYFNGELVNE